MGRRKHGPEPVLYPNLLGAQPPLQIDGNLAASARDCVLRGEGPIVVTLELS
ncbi:hypothetical protein MHH93_02105 [Priestia sp. FSL H7-0729]